MRQVFIRVQILEIDSYGHVGIFDQICELLALLPSFWFGPAPPPPPRGNKHGPNKYNNT